MAPKVSIIVPVYNAEKYLNRCVDSILAQTFTDFECILVDDGSPDGCPAICDEYAKKDSRVKVIHQKNGGVSAARNAGLDAALGEWIGFVDSDDWIEKDMFEKLIISITDSLIDIVQFDYIPFGDEKLVIHHDNLVEGVFKIDEYTDLPWWFGMSWTRFYSGKLIRENNIYFPLDISWMEDTYFSYASLACAKKIICISECLYHYFYRFDSAVNTINMKKINESIKAISKLDSFIKEKNLEKEFHTILFNLKLNGKNKFLINTKQICIKKFLTVFPELNSSLFKVKKKTKVLYVLIKLHLYFLVKLIIIFYRKFNRNIILYD